MSQKVLLTGPDFCFLETRAFEELTDIVGTQPGSILYLTQQNQAHEATTNRWRESGPSSMLRTDTFEGFVSDWYERTLYKGRVTNIDQPLLSRLVELGVEGIDSPVNPLHTGDRFPSSGLVDESRALFTELEFSGLLSPAAMRHRLETEGLDDRASHVAELAEAIETARTEILADELPETYHSERMHRVTTTETTLTDVFPAVDAVVLSGFTQFTALECDLLERLVAQWPTIALLPQQINADSTTGIDTGAQRAYDAYLELGFTREYHDATASESTEVRRQIVRSLYRHPDQSRSTDDIDSTAVDLDLVEPDTVPDELRHVARHIRTQLADGRQANNIGVVLTSPVQYTDQLQEIFETYELPFSLQVETPLSETLLGEVVETICQLAREPRTLDSVLALLTNPLVTVPHENSQFDYRKLTRVATRTETNRLDSTLEYVSESVAGTITAILHGSATLSETPLETLPSELNALLNRLGVTAALDGDLDLSQRTESRERSARECLDRVLETLALTDSVAEIALGDSVDRLERALHDASIQTTGRTDDRRITVCSLAESLPREFDQVYILGLTATHFPSDSDRMAFTDPIYNAHPDFEQADTAAEARYHVGALLGSEAAVQLSVPQRSVSGERYVEADILTELRRLIDLSEVTVETAAIPPGSQEDVQRSIGEAFGGESVEQVCDVVDQAVDAGTFDTAQQSRIKAGITCAAARSSPALTPYDGQLSEETVASIHDAREREPYSPSRLETYAACGFKYYMRRVLGIDALDSLTREPDAGARGSYVHDVLEHYYRSLQTTVGEPVHPSGEFDQRQEQLLTIALDRIDGFFANHSETAFHRDWLTKVLAGLGTPEMNPFYSVDYSQDEGQPARGLFYRFLEHEHEEPGKTTARPTWFEGRIGTPHSGGTPLGDDPVRIETPHGTVPVHGLIDRVETVPGTTPTQVVVRDYKTGSNTPSENDTLLGLNFQLPLYTLMVDDVIEDVETVGGAYYQVKPPRSVTSRSGLVTSQRMAAYHGSDEVATPFLRHSYPHFKTHEAFRRFIEDTTRERLGELAAGISNGSFQPTVHDPSDAGCRYCDYAHVCNVRPHQRRDVIESIDENDIQAYISPKAREYDVEEVVEAE